MPNFGDKRPTQDLPGYDGPDAKWPWKQTTVEERIGLALDWRSPYNPLVRENDMQVYAAPRLDLDNLLIMQDAADRVRPVQRHEAAAAFSLMMGLADDRLFSEADELSFCDISERPVARAYQAAMKVLDAYYYDKRLKISPAHLAAARIVAQCVDIELLLRDMHQKQRELSAVANGRGRLSPGTFNVVPHILARWRWLQIGGKRDRDWMPPRIASTATAVFSVRALTAPHLAYRRNLAVTAMNWRYPRKGVSEMV